jgi:hypothetical protein
MKNRLSWLLALTAGALLLAGLVRAQKTAVAKQTWEYKTIFRQRDIDFEERSRYLVKAWGAWYEDDKVLTSPVDMTAKLAQLGSQGWELVTVCPRSDNGNSHPQGASGVGDYGLYSFNGVTTGDVWIFKRPRP